ncbi:hypothetical protein [Devosia sp.]|uniref:hypothetical protein n=1 Tax=Devosia sp. TaxID=1871048 RepID=UPI0032664C91
MATSIRISVAALALSLTAGPALAQTDPVPQDKVYVSDPAACKALETKGLDAYNDMDFLTLTFDGGIQSLEYHCNFFDVKTKPGNAFTLVQAVCEIPGQVYPDLLAIGAYNDDTIQVSSMSDAMYAQKGGGEVSDADLPADAPAQDVATAPIPMPAGITLYHRCDNLSELPR